MKDIFKYSQIYSNNWIYVKTAFHRISVCIIKIVHTLYSKYLSFWNLEFLIFEFLFTWCSNWISNIILWEKKDSTQCFNKNLIYFILFNTHFFSAACRSIPYTISLKIPFKWLFCLRMTLITMITLLVYKVWGKNQYVNKLCTIMHSSQKSLKHEQDG